MTIEQMDLEPEVAAKARRLQAAAPRVVFLSGRRTLAAQAGAMAANAARNRQYLRLTYVDSSWIRLMQAWIDQQPADIATASLAQGLLAILKRVPEGELVHISLHLSGRAFDVRPFSCREEQILALSPSRFLTHEAGLVRWHVSF